MATAELRVGRRREGPKTSVMVTAAANGARAVKQRLARLVDDMPAPDPARIMVRFRAVADASVIIAHTRSLSRARSPPP